MSKLYYHLLRLAAGTFLLYLLMTGGIHFGHPGIIAAILVSGYMVGVALFPIGKEDCDGGTCGI